MKSLTLHLLPLEHGVMTENLRGVKPILIVNWVRVITVLRVPSAIIHYISVPCSFECFIELSLLVIYKELLIELALGPSHVLLIMKSFESKPWQSSVLSFTYSIWRSVHTCTIINLQLCLLIQIGYIYSFL